MATIQTDIRSVVRHVTTFTVRSFSARPTLSRSVSFARQVSPPDPLSSLAPSLKARAFFTQESDSTVVKLSEKPPVCTADELHYVSVANSAWHLALWRYLPPPQVRFSFSVSSVTLPLVAFSSDFLSLVAGSETESSSVVTFWSWYQCDRIRSFTWCTLARLSSLLSSFSYQSLFSIDFIV